MAAAETGAGPSPPRYCTADALMTPGPAAAASSLSLGAILLTSQEPSPLPPPFPLPDAIESGCAGLG